MKKCSAICETLILITVFTRTCLVCIPTQTNTIHATPSRSVSLRSNLILFSHQQIGIKVVSFLQVSSPKSCERPPPPLTHAACLDHLTFHYFITLITFGDIQGVTEGTEQTSGECSLC